MIQRRTRVAMYVLDNAPQYAKAHKDRFLDYEAMLSHPETDDRIPKVAAELLYEGKHKHVVEELPLTERHRNVTRQLWKQLETEEKK